MDTFARESDAVAKLSNVLLRHVVPLFAKRGNDKPQLVGSGFLISSGTSSYLLSAAHVFDELTAGHELFFYIGPKTTRKLTGELRLTKLPRGRDRKFDRLDVGVLKLKGPALPPYPEVQKCPLPIDAFMPNALPREGKQYLLVGFPESKSRINPVAHDLASRPYSFRNVSVPVAKYSDLQVTPQQHIVLSFDAKKTLSPNKEVRAFPDPSGMSGSPLWLLYEENGPNNSSQTPVVGIAIEHHKTQRVIVATDIEIALNLINGKR
jgi:hypothetical protein